jgi:hypothetical protein
MDHRHGGKRKTWAVGAFPNVKLSEVREHCEGACRQLKKGIAPWPASTLSSPCCGLADPRGSS